MNCPLTLNAGTAEFSSLSASFLKSSLVIFVELFQTCCFNDKWRFRGPYFTFVPVCQQCKLFVVHVFLISSANGATFQSSVPIRNIFTYRQKNRHINYWEKVGRYVVYTRVVHALLFSGGY